MSPKIARTKTRATRRKPTVRTESRMQRVRTERRELHSAVGPERCLKILDVSLVDSAVYMRWETYGWQMGKITGTVTSAAPRLVKKSNYHIFCGQTAPRYQPRCKLTTMAMGHTLATTRGSY